MPPPIRWDRQVVIRTPTVETDEITGNPREVWPDQDPAPVDALRGESTASTEDATDGQTTTVETWAFAVVDTVGAPVVITSRSQVRDGVALYRVEGRPDVASSLLTRRTSHIQARLLFISDIQESS